MIFNLQCVLFSRLFPVLQPGNRLGYVLFLPHHSLKMPHSSVVLLPYQTILQRCSQWSCLRKTRKCCGSLYISTGTRDCTGVVGQSSPIGVCGPYKVLYDDHEEEFKLPALLIWDCISLSLSSSKPQSAP